MTLAYALESELESDEELRFFSQPPPAYDDESESASPLPTSTSPLPTSTTSVALADEERAEAVRFGARRAKLQRGVVATVGGAAALLILGLVLERRANAEWQRAEAVPASPAAPLEAVETPAPIVVPELVVGPAEPEAADVVDPALGAPSTSSTQNAREKHRDL